MFIETVHSYVILDVLVAVFMQICIVRNTRECIIVTRVLGELDVSVFIV
jgi:hypothetical protein